MELTIQVDDELKSRLDELMELLQEKRKQYRKPKQGYIIEVPSYESINDLIIDLIDDCVDVWIDHWRHEP